MSKIRTTIQTAFYGNNVSVVDSLKEAYALASKSPGTVVTDMDVYNPEAIGLEIGSKVLLFNDGLVTGRCAAARKIVGEVDVDTEEMAGILREAIYQTRFKKMYYSEAFIGLDHDFMMGAHLLIPEHYENVMYNWLLNFQFLNTYYSEMYVNSKIIEKEGEIFIFSDPDWVHEDYPYGLTLFDPEQNCAAILGMRYFGEHKKGTLTLAWGIANRNGYAACHGGLKNYILGDNKNFVMAFFGLSGSGKSTLTHENHNGKYAIKILHDDAFVISTGDGSSVALEPSYFDKTQDYPPRSPSNKFLVTAQNCGAAIDEDGKLVLVTEDVRNGNGRAIKSKLWASNRVDKFTEPVNAVAWLMKDPTLPPVIKIKSAKLASILGATLATKRTTAERLTDGMDIESLVIEPYANPFRTYPLKNDYIKFSELFERNNVDCYILNTSFFGDKKIGKEITISIIESIVDQTANFVKWGNFSDLEIIEIDGFVPDMNDPEYLKKLTARLKDRLEFLTSLKLEKGGRDHLDDDALNVMNTLIQELES